MIELLLQAERALTAGMPDQAERLYWQAIEADPRNSIAIVGLARVALERRDDRTAYEFSRKALAVDPDNAAAQRLVARMTEVLELRGELPATTRPGGAPSGAQTGAAPSGGQTGATASVAGMAAADATAAATTPLGAASPDSTTAAAAATPEKSRAGSAEANSPAAARAGLLRRLTGRR